MCVLPGSRSLGTDFQSMYGDDTATSSSGCTVSSYSHHCIRNARPEKQCRFVGCSCPGCCDDNTGRCQLWFNDESRSGPVIAANQNTETMEARRSPRPLYVTCTTASLCAGGGLCNTSACNSVYHTCHAFPHSGGIWLWSLCSRARC